MLPARRPWAMRSVSFAGPAAAPPTRVVTPTCTAWPAPVLASTALQISGGNPNCSGAAAVKNPS